MTLTEDQGHQRYRPKSRSFSPSDEN